MNKDINTARLGNKLFVFNGVDPLAYVDLTKVNKGNKLKAIKRYPKSVFRFIYKIKAKL